MRTTTIDMKLSRLPVTVLPRVSLLILAFVALCLSSCWYDKEHVEVRLFSPMGRPDESVVAFLVSQRITRAPRGLAQFPDGGRAREDEHRNLIYELNLNTDSVRLLGEQAIPPNHPVIINWLAGWKGDVLYRQFSALNSDARTPFDEHLEISGTTARKGAGLPDGSCYLDQDGILSCGTFDGSKPAAHIEWKKRLGAPLNPGWSEQRRLRFRAKERDLYVSRDAGASWRHLIHVGDRAEKITVPGTAVSFAELPGEGR